LPPAPPEDPDERPQGLFGRILSLMLFAVVPPVVIAALAFGLGYVRLMHGPFSVKALTGAVQRGIAAELPGLDVRIASVDIALSEHGGIELRLHDLAVTEPNGDLVASAPMAVAGLSLPALRELRLAPERVDLVEPKLALSYGDDGRLTLSFKDVPSGAGEPEQGLSGRGPSQAPIQQGAARGATSTAAPAQDSPAAHSFDVGRLLSDAASRGVGQSGAYLKEIGIRSATVHFEHGGQHSEWNVPSLALDLEQRSRRSVVSGTATVQSSRGPWSIAFHTERSAPAHGLRVDLSVRDLVPQAIGDRLPGLTPLQMLDMPVGSDAVIELSESGEVTGGSVKIELGRGSVNLPGVKPVSLTVDAGLLALRYEPARQHLTLEPSTIVSGRSRVTLVGGASATTGPGDRAAWVFDLRSTEGVLSGEDLGPFTVPVDSWTASGRVVPRDGLIVVDGVVLKVGGAQVALQGEVSSVNGRTGARLEGQMSPMSIDTLKAIWPRAIVPETRKWIGKQVQKASIRSGSIRFASGRYLAGHPGAVAGLPFATSLTVESADVTMIPAPGMLPVSAPHVLTRVDNLALEISAPDAAVVLGPSRRLPLKSVRVTGNDLEEPGNRAEVSVRIQSPLGPVLEAIDQPAIEGLKQSGLSFEKAEGKVEGQVQLSFPVGPAFEPSLVHVEGTAKLSEGRLKQVAGTIDVQGAGITFDFSDKAIDARGEMLANGVPAKLSWQRIFDAPPDKQPPVRITASLDNADRTQLGLDVNHMVQGDVPVEVTVSRGAQGEPLVRFRADLTNAELNLDTMSWRKPSGRSAYLQCDVAKGRTGRLELQNFKIAGDDIAIEGSALLGADNRMQEFHFPSFSVNVVTRLDVSGKLRADNVWEIKAKGPTFDGRDMFRALFDVGAATVKPQKPRAGTDLDVDVDTVIGFSEVSLRGLKLKLSKRGEKLTALTMKGTLDGGQPIVVELSHKPGEARRLLADSSDAGQAFKLTGFYPNLVGGRVRLEVNVDGRGPAEKTGVLWVERFKVLGDQALSEVVGSADQSLPAIEGRRGRPGGRKVVREEFEFDRMKLPFAVGHGQFVLEDSYLSGPLLGLYMRGKADFNGRILDLGGTYIPLQGLNNVLGGIPLLGELLSGPRGEGIFGITFAIQGPMAEPKVIVNPFSPLTPGITRGLMELANPDMRVRAPEEKKPTAPVEKRVRASSAPAARGKGEGTPAGSGKAGPVDGWSSEAKPSAKGKAAP